MASSYTCSLYWSITNCFTDETQVITYGALHPDVEYTKGKQEEEDKDNHRLTHGSASSSSVLEPTGTVQDLDGDGDGDTEPDSELNEWQPDNDFQEPCDDHLNYRGDGAAASIDQAAEAPTATGPDSWMHIKPHTDHQSTQPSSASASFGSSFAASYDGSNAPYSMEEPHSTRAPVPQAPKLACAEAARPSGTKRSSAADQADRVSKPRIVPEVKGSAVPSSRARDGARGRAATNSHRRANYRSTSASPPMGIPNQIFYEGKSGVVDDSRNGLPTPSMRYMSTTYCPAIDYETFHAEVRAGLREPGQAYSGLHPRPEEASSHQAFPPHVPQNHATSAYQPVANGCATQSHTIDPTLMADTPMTDLMTPSYFDESWEIPSYNTATGSNYDNFEDFSYPQPEFYSNGAPRGSYHHHTFG